jgi:hypothetical protein
LSERAAIPKDVIIIDALPLTAVGKTFKPALVMREIEYVVRNEATQLGIDLNAVVVEQDNKLGIVAHITLPSDKHQMLEETLALYTFKTRLQSSD